MKNSRSVKLISLAAIFSLGLTACGSDSESLPENNQSVLQDADGDGYADHNDAFPDNANEWFDTDGDGVGDNADAFPHDETEQLDSDGDGRGDNIDVFPNDPNEWKDDNSNGIGDNADSGRPINEDAGGPTGGEGDCDADVDGVNWDALMTKNCASLSSYNLFTDSTDPTAGTNSGGVPFDLAIPLFTDYSSKYRFAFLPGGTQAKYTENEIFDFPVGTVLVKTFTMPVDTADRSGDELVIETRLLIHRENGWKALPYYWDAEYADGKDAKLAITGASLDVTTMHKGEQLDFTYRVPKATDCNACHQLEGESSLEFTPIGPKARNLNKDFDYASGTENQLTYWQDNGLLAGMPSAADSLQKLMLFRDDTQLNQLSAEELDNAARGYLDSNCAHCHRSELSLSERGLDEYTGPAGYTGLQLEFNRDLNEETSKFGLCKQPIANRDDTNREELKDEFPESLQYDVVPGHPEKSYLLYRMTTNNANQRMAPLGRSIHHIEGVELIAEWIKTLPEC
ncbi:SO2930 family diheme c-type cytochrome [Thalassotalea sp. Y01]|uniref:SO2930 family diheme c-type cytochrome n=1 Tax=Thalassotalea sp. Y01 TaxID=2729613 RepID=UPI00145EAD72|nr:SO2930 family diheme c-type cytochrome [Thalassotalea sp. Y01]NMP15857.1 hypothetical protein [Thalassotalea sp. Y01]